MLQPGEIPVPAKVGPDTQEPRPVPMNPGANPDGWGLAQVPGLRIDHFLNGNRV